MSASPWVHERVVLVVDDEPAVRHYVVRALSTGGYRALEADDAGTAVAMLAELGPGVIGLVVSDVAMPEVSGERLAATIARHWPGIPVLLISGQPYAGPEPFLAKPFPPEQLVETVDGLLRPRSALPSA
jgi:CheY-like chemotaxis protein